MITVHKNTVYARISPAAKLKIVKAWKNKGEVVDRPTLFPGGREIESEERRSP